MEGQGRKRKLEEEENEEEKMEKFLALIRSTKDVRDRLSKEKENINKVEEEEKGRGVWNPTFQPEDFIPDSGIRSTHLSSTSPAGPSNQNNELHLQHKEPEPTPQPQPQVAPPPPQPHNEDREKASEGDKLDLTLSL
ncbi:protein NIM1-INTERACTING 1-like [Senna tora]|uniref:Protein NIM1-INTERACTING 1-like n=1 Tax=Senna tora TaxID=362788 RepID=A0A834TBG9_9FABA|nr:protein NIM1-INTERACTING 1-like [Senna tora]